MTRNPMDDLDATRNNMYPGKVLMEDISIVATVTIPINGYDQPTVVVIEAPCWVALEPTLSSLMCDGNYRDRTCSIRWKSNVR